jgi:hypothetical protein
MKGADIGVGWIDNEGKLHFQVLKYLLSLF